MGHIENINQFKRTKGILQDMTPAMAIQLLVDGNRRFTSKDMMQRNHEWQMQETIDSQHPFAIVLGCIDSRVNPAMVFDQGIGDLFIARVGGNIINQDILGSMEYACAVVGSKLIVVLGHTACGAIKGACDNVVLGNLTATLRHIKLAIERVETPENYDRSGDNLAFIDAVAFKNVELSIDDIKSQSPVLKELYDKGEIDIVGAIYNHATGFVEFCK
jgi:carbonic anhydrase